MKKALEIKGYAFKTETDTETLAHLIEDFYEDNLERAVIQALQRVVGTYGLAVVHKDEPDKIVVARKGSPLVIGVGDDEYLIASDLAAMVEYTRDVIFLEDGEVGIVSRSGFRHTTLDEIKVSRKTTHIDFSLDQIEKGGYKHFMLKEIMDQPHTLEDTMRGRILFKDDQAIVRLGGFQRHLDALKKRKISCSWHVEPPITQPWWDVI